MLPVESMLEEFVLRVKVVEDNVSVTGFTGSVDDELKLLSEAFEEGEGVWADVDSGLGWGLVFGFDGEDDVTLGVGDLGAVDEGLVEVEDEGFLILVARVFGEGEFGGATLEVGVEGEVVEVFEDFEGLGEVLELTGVFVVFAFEELRDVVGVLGRFEGEGGGEGGGDGGGGKEC